MQGIGPIDIVGIASGWFIWIFVLGSMMWRWHVKLPQARRALEAAPDSPRKERDLRRIDLQLGHFWAKRAGKVIFVLILLLMLASTLTMSLVPLFSPR